MSPAPSSCNFGAPGCTCVGICPGQLCTCISEAEDPCAVDSYAVPAVPIQLMPSAAQGLAGALNRLVPAGGTPTRPALEGAHRYAADWAVNHPDRKTLVVLVTDGQPNDCASNLQNVGDVAATAFAATPAVRTFVIGVGPSLDNLETIATAGGGQAILINDTGGVDPTQRVHDALEAILDANTTTTTTIVTETITETIPVPCVWRIPQPPGGVTFDRNQLNVTLRAEPRGTPQIIGAVSSQADCSGVIDGWHYDDAVTPTQVHACSQTCDTIVASTEARLDLVFGCATEPATAR